ncbi:MAG: UpxY family transcription antiterminator [Dysgonamonadaceae bacterium]|jgi:transcription antitermination factor NusG|nr:UpxY family transcription antiterminator [Dysgonamonadaceae bacterium]
METIKKGWYVIYTKPRHEKKVYEDLKLRECIAYLPLVNRYSRWKDRRKVIEKPLFTSYVFVYLNNAASYYRVLPVDGFVMFIGFGGKMAMVKDSEIETIRQLIAHCQEVELAQSDVKIGEKRKISFGLLSGYDCEVVSYRGKDKIMVRIESLRQNIVAEVPREYLVGEEWIV